MLDGVKKFHLNWKSQLPYSSAKALDVLRDRWFHSVRVLVSTAAKFALRRWAALLATSNK